MLAATSEAAPSPITADEAAALARLLAHARPDSGQSRPNSTIGGLPAGLVEQRQLRRFDLSSLRCRDADIVADMTVVFALIGRIHRHPDRLGYEAEFKAIVRAWRPELGD